MNADLLLKHFNRISEARDAVPRLRRFILDLAVRGKLVEQDSNDEPAAELLKRILAEKGVKKVGTLSKDENLSAPFAVPCGWEWVKLGDVCSKTGSGSTPKGGKEAYIASGIPFLRSQNVHDDGLRLDSVAYIPAETHQRMKGTAVQPGDLLLNITGGSIGRCALVPDEFFTGNISQHVAILRLAIKDTNVFTHLIVRSPYFQDQIVGSQTGAGREGLPKNRMDEIAIPVPPLAEQCRIVAKVDELMRLCDQLEAARSGRESGRDRLVVSSLQRIGKAQDDVKTAASKSEAVRFHLDHLSRLTTRPEHIKQLRQTILSLAVQGRLVTQNPDDEATDHLLNRIKTGLHDASETRIAKINKMGQISPPHAIPAEWRWVKLADLITFGPQNGVSPREIKDESAPKCLTLTATTSGYFNPRHYKHVEISEDDCANYWLADSDVLFQRGNTREYVGIAAIFDGPDKSYIFPDLMIRVRFSAFVNLQFIHMALTSPPLRQFFSTSASGASTTMPKINQSVLLNAPVPLPPVEEQGRIIAEVKELMALCDQLEAQLATTEADSRRLLEAVLRDALLPPGQEICSSSRTTRVPASREIEGLDRKKDPASAPPPSIATEKIKTAEVRRNVKSGSVEGKAVIIANIPQRILAVMEKGREYARAEITAASGVTDADWTWAIRQLKEEGKVRQIGERRGARYARR